MWLFSIENGAKIRPLEKGRNSPVQTHELVQTQSQLRALDHT